MIIWDIDEWNNGYIQVFLNWLGFIEISPGLGVLGIWGIFELGFKWLGMMIWDIDDCDNTDMNGFPNW